MDIEGRLHSAQRRSQMTMMKFVQTVPCAEILPFAKAIDRKLLKRFAKLPALRLAFAFVIASAAALHAQFVQPTGPQQLSFAGLRANSNQGQINAARTDAQGNLYLLIDQKDGVRLLKTDPNAANILAQALIGAKGDIGLAMALDPTGNVYVTGTTTSGAMTASAAAAFRSLSGTSMNSFVAKFDANLNSLFVTFTGGGSMAASSIAATSDGAFVTGSIFNSTLPVTVAGIIQTPAYGSTSNGFVERFSADGSTLIYSTYLSGTNGSTTPSAIVADTADNAYIAGSTTSPGYPTIAAVVPAQLGATSGFLTKLTPVGDGITFSTYIPGAGMTSLAIDPARGNLLLSGSVSLGQFPVATVSTPLAATTYQVLLRMPLDGSTVLASTVLAPGTQSIVAAGAAGMAWVAGNLSQPILPLTSLSTIGDSFAVRVNSANVVDQTARFGGVASANPGNAGAPVALTSIAADPSGNAIAAGSFAPYASQSLLATQTFDLPLSSPTTAFPSNVRAAVLPASACNGSLCAGSAAYLAKLTLPPDLASATASLALSVDDSPNLTLRNLGSAQATGLQIAAIGFTYATNCGTVLPSAGECSIALTGSGPGSISFSAANAAKQTAALPVLAAAPLAVVFTPKELDFGIVSSASGTISRTFTVTNLTQQSQIFSSALDISAKTTLPYSFAETTSDCTLAGAASRLLAPGGVCHITLGLNASNIPANDGAIRQNWSIGTRDVVLTAYAQSAALSVSSSEVDFGTQYTGGLHLPRYLYLSNNSTAAIEHAAVTLPGASPFSVSDACPSVLEPLTVCQLKLAYGSARTPSADSVTLSLDQGLTALITGRTLPQPAANGASVNPNLSVSTANLNFPNPVPVTSVSGNTQTLNIQNTGAAAFALSISLTGDFTDTTNCGATLAGGATCSILFTFVPSQPGARQGLVTITAGAGTTSDLVTLSGTGAGILSPANNGTLSFGGIIAGQPFVQWFKITQPFTSFAAATTLGSSYTAVLIEDIGYGHGQPSGSAFSTNASGTCFNCWLGVRFTPASVGPTSGTLTLTSSPNGSPYVLSLAGSGLPLSGLLLTPVAQDFGPVPIHSTSATALFTLTNLVASGNPISVATPSVTGDFVLSNAATGGAPCIGTLAYTASCFVEIAFTPSAPGPRTGTLIFQSGTITATAALTGYGSPDPGLSINPSALVFDNVPGNASTQQTITLTNTGTTGLQIAAPTVTTPSSFKVSTNCSTLAHSATCSVTIGFTPATAPSTGTLAIPVTSTIGGAPVLTTYMIPLTGVYTTEETGLQILPKDAQYGPQSTGSPAVTRQFTVNNLTAKSLALSIALPRQFVLSGAPCSGLAPYASCNFSVVFLPLASGDITGTLFAQATPTDGSATLNGIGYVEGYGIGAATLAISGSLTPGTILNFGQVSSGQSTQRVLTLTNSSASTSLNIRRITSEWPFLSTTTCGGVLAPTAICTVTLVYSPINQTTSGSSSPPSTTDSGTLVIESDAASSPDLIDLTGTSIPVTVAAPSNTAPLAAFTASQNSLSFASTMAGSVSTPQTLTLDNTGTATLTIFGLQSTLDFPVTSNCSTIVPGASCTLAVTFAPQPGTAATRVGAIEISSNASTSLEFISLVGASSPPDLSLTPTPLNFGTILVGATATQPVQLTNSGSVPATLTNFSATGDYSVANGSCPPSGGTLAAGATCAVQVTFAPTQPGTRTGTLSLATSAAALPLVVSLTGIGAQSHLQVSPVSLNFGSQAIGAPGALSLTLLNNGATPITAIALAVSGDYTISAPCAVTTLAPGGSCSVTLIFTPTIAGIRAGALTITSSDIASPVSVPLTGIGNTVPNGTFTLTVSGSNSASATVTSGRPAAFNLAITPQNSFAGTVVLTCTPVVPAAYAYCSLLPSSVVLAGSAQTAAATITTVTSMASATAPAPASRRRTFGDTALCLLFPAILFTWKARTSRHPAWRRVGPVAWAIFSAIALLSSQGCGGTSISPSNLRYAAPGTYQYQVTASSVSGNVPITQTVMLNLIVH